LRKNDEPAAVLRITIERMREMFTRRLHSFRRNMLKATVE
jgi:hypothetical protein